MNEEVRRHFTLDQVLVEACEEEVITRVVGVETEVAGQLLAIGQVLVDAELHVFAPILEKHFTGDVERKFLRFNNCFVEVEVLAEDELLVVLSKLAEVEFLVVLSDELPDAFSELGGEVDLVAVTALKYLEALRTQR